MQNIEEEMLTPTRKLGKIPGTLQRRIEDKGCDLGRITESWWVCGHHRMTPKITRGHRLGWKTTENRESSVMLADSCLGLSAKQLLSMEALAEKEAKAWRVKHQPVR